MVRFFISAGETSGDMHAATVVTELKRRYPDAEIVGIAGEQMQHQGCKPLHHMHELNVMGISDVLRSLPRIRRIEQTVLGWCAEQQPDVAVLVDFSSFHMRLGRKLRKLGIPVVHFIAPKLWAWGSWRVRKLIKSQDRLACILPFEVSWFNKRGISHASYVGNPSAISCAQGWSRSEFMQHLELDEHASVLALLPGSRPQELRMHVPILVETVKRLQQQMPDVVCIVPVAPGVDANVLDPLWQLGAKAISRTDDSYALRADAAVAVSGTATLELALWDTPTVLVYKASALLFFVGSRLIKLRCLGLANIILGDRPVMPELIQEACTVKRIVAELAPLLRNAEIAAEQRREFSELHALLGDQKPATGVADLVDELVNQTVQ